MKQKCPKCSASKQNIIKSGTFFRKSDSKTISRFKCKSCGKYFSSATFSPCYNQKKRRLNPIIRNSLCSTMSMRRLAKIYGISRTTVKRKLDFLALRARINQENWLLDKKKNQFKDVVFDDLETFEHTKCKPLTLTMFVEAKTRKIIDFSLAPIGAKGHLARISRKKYGRRKNTSFKKRDELFEKITAYVDERAIFTSDQNKHYLKPMKKYFPKAEYITFKGKRGALTGQGELKKQGYDPLFSINHTFAMLRYSINRLARRTWCTTKKIEALNNHIAIYVDFHNQVLT